MNSQLNVTHNMLLFCDIWQGSNFGQGKETYASSDLTQNIKA
jgi:hypothetical protein